MSQTQVSPAQHVAPEEMRAAPLSTPAIADPGPVGLAAFAMTTFMLSVFNTNMLSSTLASGVLALALFYGGGVQLLAGMWEFRKGNTFGALAFSSYGAFWLSYYWLVHDILGGLQPADQVYKAVGVYLLAWTIFTAYMTIAAMRTNGAVLAVFVALTLTFLFLTIGEFAKNTGIHKFAGWIGLVTALLAWYASFAGVTNSTWGKTVMPTWPLANAGIPRSRSAN